MKLIVKPHEMQREALAWRQSSKRIALVPTMGALHEGHLSLVERAKKDVDVIVLSIYVNPTQFAPKEDFDKYPRAQKEDLRLAQSAGVDVVFMPSSLYRDDSSTWVVEKELSKGRCGDSRPGHFEGVATVIAKLFMLVQPHIAIFGQKDAQQCDVIERMARDLYFPIKIMRVQIVRDKQGLALSSRNQYLSEDQYNVALKIPEILQAARKRFTDSETKQCEKWVESQFKKVKGLRLEYVSIASGFLCVAVLVGETRLLDNVKLSRKLS
ncbi:MAG: pantoate--beta-alanine ligase [Verrucomicrobiota bacterium]